MADPENSMMWHRKDYPYQNCPEGDKEGYSVWL